MTEPQEVPATEFTFVYVARNLWGALAEVLVESFGYERGEDFEFMEGPGGPGVMCRGASKAVVEEVLPELQA